MALKDLLVIVDNDPACPARVEIARRLAEKHEAHLTGLHAMPRPVPLYTDMPVPQAVETAQWQDLQAAAARAEALFHAGTRGTTARTEWRVAEGHVIEVASVHARYADLTVLGQGIDIGQASAALDVLPAELALAVGRPLLMVPRYGTFPTVGEHVLVAWNGSREATRAVHDALPLLQRAKVVTVLSIDPEDTGEPRMPGGDIALHLSRHGVPVQTAAVKGADIAVGDLLLSYAADHGIDLIVMGAYGHTRLREMILGGATRDLLRSMTVPVLLSH
jgi:nucleotide-binding universal stress UspA family protein